MKLLFLQTLAANNLDQSCFFLKKFQQRRMLEAVLNSRRDLILNLPSLKSLQQVFQATVTNFFLSKLPLHMKLRIHVSMILIMLAGQLYTNIQWINIMWITNFTNWTLPTMDNKLAFHGASFILLNLVFFYIILFCFS